MKYPAGLPLEAHVAKKINAAERHEAIAAKMREDAAELAEEARRRRADIEAADA